MMPYVNLFLNYLYNNPAIGIAVFVASAFIIGYLIKKMKMIIILAIIIIFIAGFYIYNRGNIETVTGESIEKIRNMDPEEIKQDSDRFRDKTKKKFFETFKDL
ncbi:MAG: hypothetical protein JW982_02075 [Spirochaetes bacterium]|nr:hypothetical protein [Spirochaetota bacterium]